MSSVALTHTAQVTRGCIASRLLFSICLFLLCVTCGLPTQVCALTYPITNRARPCFIEEVDTHTSFITGSYVWHRHPLNAQTTLSLELRSPTNVVVDRVRLEPETGSDKERDADTQNFQASALKREGRAITLKLAEGPAKEIGPYLLCLEVEPPITGIEPHNPILLSIDVDQAATREIRNNQKEADELKEVMEGTTGGLGPLVKPSKGELQKVGKELLDLRREVERVASNMDYFLGRMDRMQRTGENTFTRVWVMAVLTIIVVCIVVYAQFRWISTTIVKKKLI